MVGLKNQVKWSAAGVVPSADPKTVAVVIVYRRVVEVPLMVAVRMAAWVSSPFAPPPPPSHRLTAVFVQPSSAVYRCHPDVGSDPGFFCCCCFAVASAVVATSSIASSLTQTTGSNVLHEQPAADAVPRPLPPASGVRHAHGRGKQVRLHPGLCSIPPPALPPC